MELRLTTQRIFRGVRALVRLIASEIGSMLDFHGGSTAHKVSSGYGILNHSEGALLDGWRTNAVAERQHEAFSDLLQAARQGKPRLDFLVASKAVRATGLTNPTIIEVGCGSGYYSELLPLLLDQPVRYLGIDYSPNMVSLARRAYPDVPFLTGDARCLPLKTGACDILLSGTSLMHIAEYKEAISESHRVTNRWCIFHTVPVMARRSTCLLKKRAYGEPVVEVIFNQAELEALFSSNGFTIASTWKSIPYNVKEVVKEPTWTLTYLCRKV